jgi:hypothetical protein
VPQMLHLDTVVATRHDLQIHRASSRWQ